MAVTSDALSGARYPAEREVDIVLRDGSTVHVRPARPGDRAALTEFFQGLSSESRWFRFFSAAGNLEPFIDKATNNDFRDRLDLVATAGTPPRIIAHALYVTTEPDLAEVAFATSDAHHERGIATILLAHLAQAARENGIHRFYAVTMPSNRRMIGVFRESGFAPVVRALPDEVHLEFPTSMSDEALTRFIARDQVACAAAVRPIVAPRGVAVIGASRDEHAIGGAILKNLIDAGFTGRILPVNLAASEIQGIRTYASIADVDDDIDLAVIAVPARHVLDVARQCAGRGLRALVVISSGFAETGAEGEALQDELLDICRRSGMRLVGPNCFGVINTDPDVSINATFGPLMPPAGKIGFLTQSGALGLSVIDRTAKMGLGLSTFISNGNKADISGNDLLCYWAADERTELVMLYLESFGNPRKFARLARDLGRTKPILVVKSGRSAAGARATTSHTGALISASDVTVDALFRQSGVVRCDTLAELFDVASLMSRQPIPSGRRVAIVTNAGGLGIMCADACEALGLDVVEFDDDLAATLRASLPAQASVGNPVDMIAGAGADDYRRVIEMIAASGAADAVIAIYIPPLVTEPEDIAGGIANAARELASGSSGVPLLAAFMSDTGAEAMREHVPVFAFPEEAAQALALAARYGEWRARPVGVVCTFDDVHLEAAAATIATALGRGAGWLEPAEVGALLDAYGICRAPERVVSSPDEAAVEAASLGFPVVVKAIVPGLVHKTDAGAVRLGLRSVAEVRDAVSSMTSTLAERPTAFLVQSMVSGGIEMLAGVVNDPLFGPVVAIGAGGVTSEIVRDVSVRLTPLTNVDVNEMIDGLRMAPLLRGYRGSAPSDLVALVEQIHRIGALVEAHPEVAEMDCNPLLALPDGAVVVDARIRVEERKPQPPIGAARPPRRAGVPASPQSHPCRTAPTFVGPTDGGGSSGG